VGSVSRPAAAYLSRYADAAIEGCWLLAAVIAPLYLDLARAQPGLARGQFVQIVVAFMALLWVVQRLAARRAAVLPAASAPPAAPPGQRWRGPLKLPAGAPLVALALAFVGTTLLATVFSPVPGVAFWGSYLRDEGAVALVAYTLLFLIVADRLRTRAQLDRLMNLLLATSVPVCLYALAQATRLDPLTWQTNVAGRMTATAGNAIFLAAYLGLLAPLTLWRLRDPERPAGQGSGSWLGALVLPAGVAVLAAFFGVSAGRPQTWWATPALLAAFSLVVALLPPFALPARLGGAAIAQRLRRLAYLGLLALQVLVIVLTASRGPVVGLVGAVAVAMAFAAWRARQWRYLAAVGGALLVLGAGLALLWIPNSPALPLAERVPLLRRFADVRSGETGARLQIWNAVAETVARPASAGPTADPLPVVRTWIGYGPESVVYVLNRVLPPPTELEGVLGEFWDRAHNASMDRLVTTGLVGLAVYVALMLAIVGAALRRIPARDGAFGWGLYFALAVALLSHLFETQFSMWALPGWAIFWLLAGVAVGVPGLDRRVPAAATAGRDAAPAPAALDGAARAAHPLAPPLAAEEAAPSRPRWRPVIVYTGLVGLVVVLAALLPLPALALPTTILVVVVALAAPLVVALAVTPIAAAPPTDPVEPAPRRSPGRRRAVGVAILVLVLALGLSAHQIRTLAADGAFRRAELAQGRGDLAGAVVAAQEAVRLAPDQPEYYHVLGQYYAAFGGVRPAQDAAPEPRPTEIAVASPGLLARDQLFTLGRFSLEEALRQHPLESRYYLTFGELYRYWGEAAVNPLRLLDAIGLFERAAALKPNDVEIQTGLGDALLIRGERARGLAAARHATALLPSYWYPFDVAARAHQTLGQQPQALAAASRAIELAPDKRGIKTATNFDIERLRQVIRQAIASGQTAVRPGALVLALPSQTPYQLDGAGQKRRFVSLQAAQNCGYRADEAPRVSDVVLAEVPAGPDHPRCP
jgi:tetratricopeptide (TPR) repeat protein